MAKKPSYPRKGAPKPIKKKAGQTSGEDGAQKDKATGRGLQRKMENGPEKAWKPQRSSRPTSTRETTTLFTSAVHPLNSLSITGPEQSAKQIVPEVANSNEVKPRHNRQHQVL